MSREGLERFVESAASAARITGPNLRGSYRGALLGVAVGNVLGLPVEGLSRRRIAERFPNGLTEMDRAERERPWDDDLAQTVVLAEALLDKGDLDPEQLGSRMVRWAEENGRGMGSLTAQVIRELAAGTPAKDAARVVWERSGRSAAGNGALMRCAPVALRWRRSGRRLIEESIKSASVTHHDPRCVWSVVALNSAVALTLSQTAPDLERLALLVESAGAPQEVGAAIRFVGGRTLESFSLDGPDMGYTLKAMRVGLWAFQQEDDFESVLVRVVNAGGDTDTNGAIAGAVMGCRVGAGRIPARWLENIREIDRLVELADRLFEASEGI